jgi:hypothetical protein
VAREQWSDRPFDPFVLFAWLPPEAGAFLRDGAPWKGIAYATPNPRVLGKSEMPWKIQATMDESYLYVRFEANAPDAFTKLLCPRPPRLKSSALSA